MQKEEKNKKKLKAANAMQTFDETYQKVNDAQVVLKRFGAYLLDVISVILMCIPGKEVLASSPLKVLAGCLFVVLNLAFFFHMNIYFRYLNQNQQTKTIYELLQYYPIPAKEILKSRLQYFFKYTAILTSIFLLVQIVFGYCRHTLGNQTIFYIIGLMGGCILTQLTWYLVTYLFRSK